MTRREPPTDGDAPIRKPVIREVAMLSRIDAHRTATVLLDRLGEVAVAAAVLRAQQAGRDGRYQAMIDWRLIAEAAAARLVPVAGPSAGR